MDLEAVEREFPIKRETAYLNNASYTPMFDSGVSEAAARLRDFSRHGPDDAYYLTYRGGANVARERLAGILGARPEGFIFTESATQAINLVANGFRFARGDAVVTRGGPTTEHPSDYLPWLYYSKRKGASIRDVPVDDSGLPDLGEFDSAVREARAKIVVTSHVLYNLGTVQPAEELCRIAHERGATFFLDVSQSAGSTPVDLDRIGCDFAAGTASKWFCGPLGVGYLYCKEGAGDLLDPLNFGANSTEYVDNLNFRELRGAGRLQEGFRNWAYVYAFAKALEVWSRIGLEEIRANAGLLAKEVFERVSELKSRYRLLVDYGDGRRSCIVPVETLREKPADVVQRALKSRVVVAQREYGERRILRISPHFYNDEPELERLFSVL